MKKAILISIKPKWVTKILNGEKTVEIRNSIPKCELPIDVYIYCTKDKKYANLINRGGFLTGMVVAKFTLNKIEPIAQYDGNEERYFTKSLWETELFDKSCLSLEEMRNYIHNHCGYAWHIDNLEIFDKPMKLKCFKRVKWEKCGVKDKNGLYQCNKCPYAIHYGHGFGDCGYDLPIKAPQSWCYVEVQT